MLLKGILEDLGVTVVATATLPLIREASPNSKVVMVTGNIGTSFVEKAIAKDAKGYIKADSPGPC